MRIDIPQQDLAIATHLDQASERSSKWHRTSAAPAATIGNQSPKSTIGTVQAWKNTIDAVPSMISNAPPKSSERNATYVAINRASHGSMFGRFEIRPAIPFSAPETKANRVHMSAVRTAIVRAALRSTLAVSMSLIATVQTHFAPDFYQSRSVPLGATSL